MTLMCDECFELFNEDDLKEQSTCPLKLCSEGELVKVDDEIAYLVSKLNKSLTNLLPIKTIFTCSGHLPLNYHSYIGFDVNAYDDDEFDEIADIFIDLVKPAVEKLNSRIRNINGISIIDGDTDIYIVYKDILNYPADEISYRIFINTGTSREFDSKIPSRIKLKRNKNSEIDINKNIRIINQIIMVFKEFLMDLCDIIDDEIETVKLMEDE